jgi:hypothetical protein
MRVKLRNARAYAPAAYVAVLASTAGIAITLAPKLRARAQVLVAFLAILAAIAIPGIAHASADIPNATHHGTWRIHTTLNFTQSNPSYVTHTTVSGCVDITSDIGTYGWKMAIIWYNGGRNTVLWRSREFSDNDFGPHCSPKLRVHGHHPKVFSTETINCNLIVLPCGVDGDWSLRTN